MPPHLRSQSCLLVEGSCPASSDRLPAPGGIYDGGGDLPPEYEETLRGAFGIARWRPKQKLAVNLARQGKDIILVWPTGYGKSICFQLPAFLATGLTIVIAPHLSLVMDQVKLFEELNLAGTADGFCAGMSFELQNDILHCAEKGELKLLYITPEKLMACNDVYNFLRRLHQNGLLNRIVVDEAHTLGEYGQSFRPACGELPNVLSAFPGIPITALTATLDPRGEAHLIRDLFPGRRPESIRIGLDRGNLSYEVHKVTSKKVAFDRIVALLLRDRSLSKSKGIVYCRTKKETEELAAALQAAQIKAAAYHADLSDYRRTEAHEAFRGEPRAMVICATNAFGMGIDIRSVRFVVHLTVPPSPGRFSQESGRAGRDGEPARSIVFYSFCEYRSLAQAIARENLAPSATKERLEALRTMALLCADAEKRCFRHSLLQALGEDSECTDQCERGRPVTDITALAVSALGALRSFRYAPSMKALINFLRGLLPSSWKHHRPAEAHGWGSEKRLSEAKIKERLEYLVLYGVLSFKHGGQNSWGGSNSYIECGPVAWAVLNRKETVLMTAPQGSSHPQDKRSPAHAGAAAEPPPPHPRRSPDRERPGSPLSPPPSLSHPPRRRAVEIVISDSDSDSAPAPCRMPRRLAASHTSPRRAPPTPGPTPYGARAPVANRPGEPRPAAAAAAAAASAHADRRHRADRLDPDGGGEGRCAIITLTSSSEEPAGFSDWDWGSADGSEGEGEGEGEGGGGGGGGGGAPHEPEPSTAEPGRPGGGGKRPRSPPGTVDPRSLYLKRPRQLCTPPPPPPPPTG